MPKPLRGLPNTAGCINTETPNACAMDKKTHSLVTTYMAMDSAEIERRLAGGQLTDLARRIAQEELESRAHHPEAEPPLVGEAPASRPQTLVGIAVIAALPLIFLYWILPTELAIALFVLVGMPIVLAYFGRSFPLLGFCLGWILIASPVGLAWWMWANGYLAWQGGDFRPIGTILAYIALFFGSGILMLMGGSMLGGALHEGTDSEFEEDLRQRAKESLDNMRR